jgi:hypothetical protein
MVGGVPRADALTTQPAIVPRSQWADSGCTPQDTPDIGRHLQVAFVHHTVGSNSYAPSDSAGILRGICSYHINALGWDDIGYNFLVDRFGTVFEGRAGGIDRAVVGAQTAGFNSKSTGVAVMGTFTSTAPPKVVVDALTRLLAWKLDVHHVDPLGSSSVVSGGNDDHAAGERVTLRNVSGHRDAVATECPGNGLYPLLPSIAAAAAGIGLPKAYTAGATPDPARLGPSGAWPAVSLTAHLTSDTAWTLTVKGPGGDELDSWSGTGTAPSATWRPLDAAGAPLPSGDYTWVLDAGPDTRPITDTVTLGDPSSFDTYILVGNPSTDTAHVRLDLATPDGEVTPYSLDVPPAARRTVFLNEILPGAEISTHLSSTIPVVAERASYFDYKLRDIGGSDAVGATAPATSWYFAEGYTATGFEEYLTLQNPGLTPTAATVTYMFPGGTTAQHTLTLTATSRTTVSVNKDVGPGREVSARVTSDLPIVAERPMYYTTGRWKGGDTILGVAGPSQQWYFAEGYTGDGFDEWLTVQNPSVTPTVYSVRYMDNGGELTTTEHTIAGLARDTVDVRAEAGAGREVSMQVTSPEPIVAERPMYFTYHDSIRDGHNSTGVTAPGTRYFFAEGYTGSDFDEYLTVLNPGATPATVSVRYLLEDGPPVTVEHTVAPQSRATIVVADEIGRGHGVSADVTSDTPVVVERPMYFNYYGAWDGGHVAVGVAAPSRDWYFAEGFTG